MEVMFHVVNSVPGTAYYQRGIILSNRSKMIDFGFSKRH